MSPVVYDMAEDLGEIEGWLDGLTSTLSALAGIKKEPDTLVDIIERVSKVPEFASLVQVKEDVERLYECTNCVAYGIVTLDDEELREAGWCFEEVYSALEKVLDTFAVKAQAPK
jgi:hypothetical protein